MLPGPTNSLTDVAGLRVGHATRPEPGWLCVALSSENLGGGMMEEDARIWDSAGNLVAQSRQLCAVRTAGA